MYPPIPRFCPNYRLPVELETAALGSAMQAAACQQGIPVAEYVRQNPAQLSDMVRVPGVPYIQCICRKEENNRRPGLVLHPGRGTKRAEASSPKETREAALPVTTHLLFPPVRCPQVITPDPCVKGLYQAAYARHVELSQTLFGGGPGLAKAVN